MTDVEQAQNEIEALHVFFVEWFTSAAAVDDGHFERGFASHMGRDFEMIVPSGDRRSRDQIFDAIRGAHGVMTDFNIQIRNVELRTASDAFIVASYEEWQRGARGDTAAQNARYSMVVFRRNDTAPNGLEWVFLQETMMSEDLVRGADFSF